MNTFSAILDLWPNRISLARELDQNPATISAWWQRDQIPARYWTRLVEAATLRDFEGVTFERLANLAARETDLELGRQTGEAA